MRLRSQKGALGPCTFQWIPGVEGTVSCSTLSWAPSAFCRPLLSLVSSHFSNNALSPHLSPHQNLPHPALCPLVVSAEDLVLTGKGAQKTSSLTTPTPHVHPSSFTPHSSSCFCPSAAPISPPSICRTS